MHINVSGKNMNVGASLTELSRERLTAIVEKYFENAVSSSITFSKEKKFFKSEIRVNEGTGNNIIIKSSAEGEDAPASFTEALGKVEKCLRRYKRRIKDHKHIHKNDDIATIASYVLSQNEEEESESQENDTPVVISENNVSLRKISVSNAVMIMNLEDVSALMFIDSNTSNVCTVYKRSDGNISWVDSGIKANK